jgi:mannose-6-phosphate isomerase-like protein (cupin superfamily)
VIVIDHRRQELASWRPGNTTRLDLGAATGATRLCILEQWFEPGRGAPTHTHFDVEESITIRAGRARFWVGEEQAELEAEMTIVLPPLSWHGFANSGTETLHLVAVYSSAEVTTVYEEEPASEYSIGALEGERVDPARVRRP